MKLTLIKRPDGFWEEAEEHDYARVRKYQPGEMIECRASKIRDPVNHRRYFVMHRIYFENQEEYTDPKVCRKAIEMEAGYFEEVTLHYRGEEIKRRWPKSIAYDELGEDEFVPIKASCGDVICEKLNMLEADLEHEIDEVLKLAYIN